MQTGLDVTIVRLDLVILDKGPRRRPFLHV
jgi:hypothetical protein